MLIPCHGIQVALADAHGYLIDAVNLPPVDLQDGALHPRGTPVPLGLRWASREPERMSRFLRDGTVDVLLLGLRNGLDHVVQLTMSRRDQRFTCRDVALLWLLEPPLDRLFRERPMPHLPHRLTVQERRVLRLVAAGHSNAQIAERMGIASCTVRKHLEHAFPKLGVTNRLAAAMAFERSLSPAPSSVPAAKSFA